jgi:hypothetical protein
MIKEQLMEVGRDEDERRDIDIAWGRGWKQGYYHGEETNCRCPYTIMVNGVQTTLSKTWEAGCFAGWDAKHGEKPEGNLSKQRKTARAIAEKTLEVKTAKIETPKLSTRRPKTDQKVKKVRLARQEDAPGRTATQVKDPAEIAKICALYKGNGGTMTFKEIENTPEFNLRQTNGMTAYRIINAAKAAAQAA